jgi:hypothetical protein
MEEEEKEPAIEQVIFDSTQPDDDDEPDEIPVNDDGDGPDLSRFTPTFGNVSRAKEPVREIQIALGLLGRMGIKPSSTVGGEHNTGSKHYHGHAFDLGLNTSFGGDMEKLRTFMREFPNQQRRYPVLERLKLRDETVRPKGQKVWSGAHLHLELDH